MLISRSSRSVHTWTNPLAVTTACSARRGTHVHPGTWPDGACYVWSRAALSPMLPHTSNSFSMIWSVEFQPHSSQSMSRYSQSQDHTMLQSHRTHENPDDPNHMYAFSHTAATGQPACTHMHMHTFIARGTVLQTPLLNKTLLRKHELTGLKIPVSRFCLSLIHI